MGLLGSIIGLAAVVGFGWFTIYYLIPKLEGTSPPSSGGGSNPLDSLLSGLSPSSSSEDDDSGTTDFTLPDTSSTDDIIGGLEDSIAGLGIPGLEGKTPARAPEGTEVVSPKKKKGKGEYLSSEEAGKDNRKKSKKKSKKKAKNKMTIINYLGYEPYWLDEYQWEY